MTSTSLFFSLCLWTPAPTHFFLCFCLLIYISFFIPPLHLFPSFLLFLHVFLCLPPSPPLFVLLFLPLLPPPPHICHCLGGDVQRGAEMERRRYSRGKNGRDKLDKKEGEMRRDGGRDWERGKRKVERQSQHLSLKLMGNVTSYGVATEKEGGSQDGSLQPRWF